MTQETWKSIDLRGVIFAESNLCEERSHLQGSLVIWEDTKAKEKCIKDIKYLSDCKINEILRKNRV